MEKKMAKNVSSGAKKVQKIEEKQDYSAQQVDPVTPQKRQTKTTTRTKAQAKTQPAKSRQERAKQKERIEAEKRVEEAKNRAAKKEQRLMHRAKIKQQLIEKRAKIKEKRLEKQAAEKERRTERLRAREQRKAALKAKRLQVKADREARREVLKNESKAEKNRRISREKKERIALRRKRREARDRARENRLKARESARERKADSKKHKREQKTERKSRSQGFGGWLAAVISLGVASLALSTVVTAGAIRMNNMNVQTESSYRSTLFEMVSVSEDMDDNLSKLRVSSGADEQRRLLTDLLVDSYLMENALERIPIDAATSTDISSFVNRTGAYAKTLLNRLAAGKSMTETEKNTVAYLSEVNATLYQELNEIVTKMDKKDFRAFLNGKESDVQHGFEKMGQDTHKNCETALDAPFSGEGNVGHNRLEDMEEITLERATELAKEYFSAYHVKEVHATGETLTHNIKLYNFVLTDESGNEIYAEISARGGALMFFDTYEICSTKNFDMDACDALAQDFLKSLGIENVEAAYRSDRGMVADITYVGVVNGVRVYPESIKVRVCEEKGRVVGMDASAYLFNHTEREIAEPAYSERQALEGLSPELVPYELHLALVAQNGEEALAYEIACYTQTENFLVYVNAQTGEEIMLYRIHETNGGKFVR